MNYDITGCMNVHELRTTLQHAKRGDTVQYMYSYGKYVGRCDECDWIVWECEYRMYEYWCGVFDEKWNL